MVSNIWWIYRLIGACLVGALVFDMYQPTAVPFVIDEPVYMAVLAFVMIEPAFWMITHMFGGVMMGLASGGILDALKLSGILGVGLGASRLWPPVLAAGLAVYAADGPMLYSYGGIALAVCLFGLERMLFWFWKSSPMANRG